MTPTQLETPPKRICHVVFSTNRIEYLTKTFESQKKYVDYSGVNVHHIFIDDYPLGRDDTYIKSLASLYGYNEIILHTENKGITRTWQEFFDLIKDRNYDYILHNEDDVELLDNIKIIDLIELLKKDNTLSQVQLKRQNWYHYETEPVGPKETDIISNGYRLEKGRFFSMLFSLYPAWISKIPFLEKTGNCPSEWVVADYLSSNYSLWAAVLKKSDGSPLIKHIGEYTIGKRVEENEIGWENFSHLADPTIKYCSKSGIPWKSESSKTIHVLTSTDSPSGLSNRIDAFSVAAYKYIKYLSSSYNMIHYGLPGSTVDCENVTINVLPGDIQNYNKIAGVEIQKRKKPGDIIVCFYGSNNKTACDMNADCTVIEPSIGYTSSAVFAPYKVFTSNAHMHMYYGEKNMLMSPSWFDAVIPNSFTISEFEYSEDKEDYFLYFGRVIQTKGIDLCIQATERLGKKLIIAGAGSLFDLGYTKIPEHVTVLGRIESAEQRNLLMKKATALLGPTYYVEPFGNMVIEANLCGTPVITTDWGGFTETVVNGKTGFRIRDFKQMLDAMDKVKYLKPLDCRAHGLKYDDKSIHDLHDQYLQRIIKGNFYG